MTTLLFYCTVLFIITYFAIKKFITLAPKLGLVDIPNERSSHKTVTPRGAGLVFGFIFLMGIIFFDLDTFSENKYTFLAILIIYICGVVDDRFTISAKQKLVFIVISSIIVYFNGFEITNIGTFFNISVNLGYFALPFTIFALIVNLSSTTPQIYMISIAKNVYLFSLNVSKSKKIIPIKKIKPKTKPAPLGVTVL
jgi:UDP-GlcNAc:undecaprenyl-phosphate GlcNAc-1-phosphate transferase